MIIYFVEHAIESAHHTAVFTYVQQQEADAVNLATSFLSDNLPETGMDSLGDRHSAKVTQVEVTELGEVLL